MKKKFKRVQKNSKKLKKVFKKIKKVQKSLAGLVGLEVKSKKSPPKNWEKTVEPDQRGLVKNKNSSFKYDLKRHKFVQKCINLSTHLLHILSILVLSDDFDFSAVVLGDIQNVHPVEGGRYDQFRTYFPLIWMRDLETS